MTLIQRIPSPVRWLCFLRSERFAAFFSLIIKALIRFWLFEWIGLLCLCGLRGWRSYFIWFVELIKTQKVVIIKSDERSSFLPFCSKAIYCTASGSLNGGKSETFHQFIRQSLCFCVRIGCRHNQRVDGECDKHLSSSLFVLEYQGELLWDSRLL